MSLTDWTNWTIISFVILCIHTVYLTPAEYGQCLLFFLERGFFFLPLIFQVETLACRVGCTSMALGDHHTLFLDDTGSVWASGDNKLVG